MELLIKPDDGTHNEYFAASFSGPQVLQKNMSIQNTFCQLENCLLYIKLTMLCDKKNDPINHTLHKNHFTLI